MAEEVEISNVGGEGGVASEATLASLTRAIERLAASTGKDPKKEAAKVQKMHTRTLLEDIKAIEDAIDAEEEKTKATKRATDTINRYSRATLGALGGFLGSVTSSVLGLGKALFDGTDQLSDFAEHIPLVGSYLTTFTDILDDTFDVFRNLSSSGASFNNSMVDLMRASAEARMSISDFGSLVARNSDKLAAFGGTVTRGATSIGRLQQGLGSMRNDLLNMGFTFEEINEGLINFAFLNRAGNRAQIQDQQQLALAAGEYLMHLGELSKLTGKSVDELQSELRERQTNAAFQMRLAQMEPEQRRRIQENLAIALAEGGQAGADRFMQMVLGMGPLTEETAMLAATMPLFERTLRNMVDTAMNTTLSAEQFQREQERNRVEIVRSAIQSAENFEGLISAAASGIDGPASTLLNILNGMGIDFARYAGLQGAALEEAILADIQSAEQEQRRRDSLTQSMAAFNERVTEARRTIQEQFINSGIYEHAATLVEKFSDLFASETMMNAIKTVIDLLGDFADGLFGFMAGFSASNDPKEYLKSAVLRIGDIIQDYLFGQSAEEQQTEALAEQNRIEESVAAFEQRMAEIQSSLISAVDPDEIRRLNTEYNSLLGEKNRLEQRSVELSNNINAGFEDTPGIISQSISSLWEDSSLITKVAVGAAGLFAAAPIVAAVANGVRGLLSLFTGSDIPQTDAAGTRRGSERNTPSRSSRTVGGRMGSNIGGAFGGLTGGLIEGVGNGLAAVGAKAPLVIAGAGAIGAAITAIGAGIAGATWLIGESLPNLAEGLQEIEDLDGSKLSDAGLGMAAVAAGIAAFGAGSAVAGLGALVGSITEGIAGLFGAENPMDKLQRFAEYNIDAARVENNARALTAFSLAMASAGAGTGLSGIGAAIGAIGNSIAEFFGSETGIPYSDILEFQGYNFDSVQIRANADALVAFNQALMSASGVQAVSGIAAMVGGITSFIGGLFGADSPIEQVKEFGDMPINAQGVVANANAMSAMVQALSNMTGMDLSNVEIPRQLVNRLTALGEIEGGGLLPVAEGMIAIANVQGLQSNFDILHAGLDIDKVNDYTEALEDLVETLNDLNQELSRDNNGFGFGTGTNAGDVLGQINTASTGSSEGIDRLNRTMSQVLAVLQEMAEDADNIERNTRSNGSNIANGRISAIR